MLKSNRGDLLRWTLLGVLGAPLCACGGTTEAPGTGGTTGSGGSPATGGGTASGGSETASGGTVSSGGSSSTGGASTGGASTGCANPVDVGGGFVRCEAGQLHREVRGTCPTEVPRAEAVGDPAMCSIDQGCCVSDADCTGPNQYCGSSGFGLEPGPSCQTGCLEDADCGEGMICRCGDLPMGQCSLADCAVDDDCSGEFLCTSWETFTGCNKPVSFVCQTAEDECGGPGDCLDGQECVFSDGARHCKKSAPDCVAGRPFLVEDEIRTAPVIARTDWACELMQAEDTNLSLELSDRLAAHFEHAAKMEHASIGAFARFSLQLLSLGAPAVLIEETNQALIDETRHARQCFALASRYRGKAVGPGALNIDHALSTLSPESILNTTILEGCIGETIAALEAAEAAEGCTDFEVQEILRGIAKDEGQHAELAWKSVRWILTERPSLAEAARTTFERALSEVASTEGNAQGARHVDVLRSHGVLSEAERRSVRAFALRQIVSPCVDQLFAWLDAQKVRSDASLSRSADGAPKFEQHVRA